MEHATVTHYYQINLVSKVRLLKILKKLLD